jgi:type VI secretion system secreted protein Hcp
MFLKLTGVTGEAQDSDHKGEIQVVSWSWGLQSPAAMGGSASTTGRTALEDVSVIKRVDRSTPTLMQFVRTHKVVPSGVLIVRKAGSTPLEYLRIELSNVRITSLRTHSDSAELMEEIRLGCTKIKVVYTPQSSQGGKGGGEVTFEADAFAGS